MRVVWPVVADVPHRLTPWLDIEVKGYSFAKCELVPGAVRKQGPWQGMRRGEVDLLKPEYRLALARPGNSRFLVFGSASV